MAYPRSQRSRAFKLVNYSAGNLTTTSTSYTDTTIADIVLAAQTGDTIEFGVNLLVSNSGATNLTAIEIATVAAGAALNATPINYFASSAVDGSFRTQNPTASVMWPVCGSVMYVLTAGDISIASTVTLRTRWKVNTGTGTITADGPNRRAHLWAKNLGPAAPH